MKKTESMDFPVPQATQFSQSGIRCTTVISEEKVLQEHLRLGDMNANGLLEKEVGITTADLGVLEKGAEPG